MFRLHALGGVSVLALQVALLAPTNVAQAQGGEQALPPVVIDAPAPAKRAVRKPAPRVASGRRQSQRAAAAPARASLGLRPDGPLPLTLPA